MAWDAYHHRTAVLREAMQAAETRRDGSLPWSELPDAAQTFGTPDRLLGALQMRWHTRLTGTIERELDADPGELERGVVRAWRRCAAEMPGLRALLDAHANTAALGAARRKEWVLLASAAGVAAMGDTDAAGHGRRLEERARAVRVLAA